MRYFVLATDYDGTIAHNSTVPKEIVESLKTLKASGRTIILVTGRELDELKDIFSDHNIFDRIVAENGALVYNPATLEETLLGDAPPKEFVEELKRRGVHPVSAGRVIVATWEPHQNTVLEVIKQFGIERQIIFNKGAVMILPPGINKAKGLKAALIALKFSFHNVVAVGDAENDSAMLQAAECAVSVSNALPALKDMSDLVTVADHGYGVKELIEQIRNDDLASLDEKMQRHYLEIGSRFDNAPFMVSPYGTGIVVAGSSGGGKTTLTAAFMESLTASGYQYCLIDPEGDYLEMKGAVAVGDATQPPAIEPLMQLLEQPQQSVVACTLALSMNEKPVFLQQLLAEILKLRQDKGRPHWLILDEAHHLAPVAADVDTFSSLSVFSNFMAITTKPELLHKPLLERTNTVIAVGEDPEQTIDTYAEIIGVEKPIVNNAKLQKGEVLVWQRESGEVPFLVRTKAPQQVLQRHKRKYATGDMAENSFYFTGPENKLKLKANNLQTFMQLAEGVDDDTWLFHLRNHDYSKWMSDKVNDNALAEQVERVENMEPDALASRESISKLIQLHYTGQG
ncbi:HAD-IIB family hydrolase [Danxiaibacter flavus]|uniref:HAD-IIB family hydrolase n=1 Tax=Danxiaibacter flavus TaxID=3049108 RepID=A0ABV3ZCK1_9BACT|nr:HAD-IIB family hydrolase [Chitinophagaceae bacterium DXS]